MAQEDLLARHNFPHIIDVPVRWNDYDIAYHVNNVQFYAYFEEVVVSLLDALGLDWVSDPVIPFVAESKCRFLAPIRFGSKVTAGIGIERLGNSSLTYTIALFVEGQDKPVAQGHFVHVFVNRKTEAATPIPAAIRDATTNYLMG